MIKCEEEEEEEEEYPGPVPVLYSKSSTKGIKRYLRKKGRRRRRRKKKKKKLIACRGLGRVVGPLLAARALPLCCAASAMLSSTLLAI